MSAFAFAWRSLRRQPARALLGVLGVASVGALLFDMLLLSNGLVLSMEQVLAGTGFDLRVGRGPGMPGSGWIIPDATNRAGALTALPEVEEAVPIRFGDGAVASGAGGDLAVRVVATTPSRHPAWMLHAGRSIASNGAAEIVINPNLARGEGWEPGDEVSFRAYCTSGNSVTPPVSLRVVGIAEFPFEDEGGLTVGTSLRDLDVACGGNGEDIADQFLVVSAAAAGTAAARSAIEEAQPGFTVAANEEIVGQLQGGLSYFRQISLVLITVTIGFAFLLVTVLLTVSVNQRTGEIAALRALGFSRRRVVADVLSESVLLVGTGCLLALPLGLGLARVLDRILKSIPGIPEPIHFFVYQPRAVAIHFALFALTAVVAAAWPMLMVARLPIAATLRREVVS
ncbi:MAG: ABC transporter permease [Acidimicrobiia bacterium]|nr:ABC transporter permease [Acidimicrobiia bacterium]